MPLMVANITSYTFAAKFSPMPIYDALLLTAQHKKESML
jgi:hypothetical protein